MATLARSPPGWQRKRCAWLNTTLRHIIVRRTIKQFIEWHPNRCHRKPSIDTRQRCERAGAHAATSGWGRSSWRPRACLALLTRPVLLCKGGHTFWGVFPRPLLCGNSNVDETSFVVFLTIGSKKGHLFEVRFNTMKVVEQEKNSRSSFCVRFQALAANFKDYHK